MTFRNLPVLSGFVLLGWMSLTMAALGRMPAAGDEANPTAALPVAPILATNFLGWARAYRLQNDQVKAVLVPDIGRLVHFSAPKKPNALRLDPELQGHLPPESDPFYNIGGDWLWPVAQARWGDLAGTGEDWPPPAALAEAPWECSAWTDSDGAQYAQLSRVYGDPLHIKVSRQFRLEPDSDTLVVLQRIERTAPSDVPVILWNISQVQDADQIVLPVEADSRFPSGLKTLRGRRSARRLTDCGRAVVYRVTKGGEIKLGSDSRRGWIAAAAGPQVLFESVVRAPGPAYPEGACVVEFYSHPGHGYSEIETLSPEVALAPGQVLENTLRMKLARMEAAAPAPCDLADFVRGLAGE